eukprot:CAMPEP_0173214330 /NCGR_PEP_ID=MMETSP1141-20130122/25891_1 /TAXON_ID=483371 /ORGANISM="non described non described, Strain CCMP2298" /LENGTH=90 /DNA_ID=CAMNT_0014141639 /DNA_START=533 /DNA_END=805 /DNA_ORIENTATION=-
MLAQRLEQVGKLHCSMRRPEISRAPPRREEQEGAVGEGLQRVVRLHVLAADVAGVAELRAPCASARSWPRPTAQSEMRGTRRDRGDALAR